MADEFDPSKLDRIVSKMAELQLSLAELVRESVKNDNQAKVEQREEIDTTAAAVKVVEQTLEREASPAPVLEIQPFEKPQEFRQPDSFPSAPSMPEVESTAPIAPGREQDPLDLPTFPAFETTLPPQEQRVEQRVENPLPPLNLDVAADIALPVLNQPAAQEPVFTPSSTSDAKLPEVQMPQPMPLELPGDKLDTPPDLKGIDPPEIPPFVVGSSPVVRLDQTTQQTHWEQDMFADAVSALGDYRDESRRWRTNLISILEHINNDLRMDNTILESILRHFELSRRSP